MACNGRCLEHYLRLAKMENKRRTPTRSSTASRFLSTFESAGLAAAATFAGALWVGLALPGLPLLPGVGGGQNSNVAIALNSAVLGVQDSRTFAGSAAASGRQARLLSLLLPTPDPLGKKLATKRPDTQAGSDAPMVIALPALPPSHAENPPPDTPRVVESSQVAPTVSVPAPSPPEPARLPAPSQPPPPRAPEPDPPTPARPTDPNVPSSGAQPPLAGDTPWNDPTAPDTASPLDPGAGGSSSGNGNGSGTGTGTGTGTGVGNNGNGNGNSGGNNPNAGGGNPNAGGGSSNAGGNGNGNGNSGGKNPNAGGGNPNAGGANAGGNGNAGGNNPNAGGGNPNAGGGSSNAGGNGNAGGNNPNAGGANAGGNGNGAPKGSPKKGP